MQKKSSILFQIIIALLAWFALGLQQYILINNTPGNGMTPFQAVGRFLIFFTILSNLLVAISLTVLILRSRSAAGRFFSKPSAQTAIAVYILIVGIVYNIILRWMWKPSGLQMLADELLHVVVPFLYVLYWFLYVPKGMLNWKNAFPWLVFPAAYVIYALIRGATEGFYPYPFIDVEKIGYARVAINSLGLMAAFTLTGFFFIAIDKYINRKKSLR